MVIESLNLSTIQWINAMFTHFGLWYSLALCSVLSLSVHYVFVHLYTSVWWIIGKHFGSSPVVSECILSDLILLEGNKCPKQQCKGLWVNSNYVCVCLGRIVASDLVSKWQIFLCAFLEFGTLKSNPLNTYKHPTHAYKAVFRFIVWLNPVNLGYPCTLK